MSTVRQAATRWTKSALAVHLSTTAHGNVRCLTPTHELRRWSVQELENEHARLCTYGRCEA